MLVTCFQKLSLFFRRLSCRGQSLFRILSTPTTRTLFVLPLPASKPLRLKSLPFFDFFHTFPPPPRSRSFWIVPLRISNIVWMRERYEIELLHNAEPKVWNITANAEKLNDFFADLFWLLRTRIVSIAPLVCPNDVFHIYEAMYKYLFWKKIRFLLIFCSKL